MSNENAKHKLVLAIQPSTQGLGYALFEGPRDPIDWGVKYTKTNNAEGVYKVKEFINFYHPDAIVVEDYAGEGSRRCERVQRLIKDIKKLAKTEKIKVYEYSRSAIRKTFTQFGAKTKYQIAQKIVEWMPTFLLQLPPERKIWKGEDARMSIFSAVSLALTYFYTEE